MRAPDSSPRADPPAVEQALQQIRENYARMEPPGRDAWNPLSDEVEMWHRVRLLLEACRMLRMLPRPLGQLRVLDVGCGIGRSARMLVDLGADPARTVAIDLRPEVLEAARQRNPAIQWQQVSGLDDWPEGPFDLAVQCTVFSSIPGPEARQATADRMSQVVGPQGHILWWDSRTANDFAGGDPVDPRTLFPDRELLDWRTVPLLAETRESLRPLRGLRPVVERLLSPLAHRRSHCVALFGPQRQASVQTGTLLPMAAAATSTRETRAAATDLLHANPPRPIDDVGLSLGAWEMFQHRPLLQVYADHYGHELREHHGVLMAVKRVPLLGGLRAQVYGPEAVAGADWSERLDDLPVGEMVVMSNRPAAAHWGPPGEGDLVSMVIDLRGDVDALWGRFEQRARTAARKGAKAGVVVAPSTDEAELLAYYEVVRRMSADGSRFPLTPLPLIRALLGAGHGTLYVARQGEVVLGGCVVLRHRYAHALLSGFDAAASGGLPSTHLYVQIMEQEQARGMPFLDFGPHDVQAHAGLVLAKRAFSPLIVPAFRYQRPGAGWRPGAVALLRRWRGGEG